MNLDFLKINVGHNFIIFAISKVINLLHPISHGLKERMLINRECRQRMLMNGEDANDNVN